MKKSWKNLLLLLIVVLAIALVGCGNKENENRIDTPTPTSTNVENVVENNTEEDTSLEIEEDVFIPKSEQIGTAGSNIPLKDNYPEAEYQIKVAVQNLFQKTYGDKVFDARIYVEKIYSVEEEEAIETVKEMNLGPNEVAFEIKYDLKPAQGADPMELMIPNGEYDEESGWIKDCTRLGVLRPNDSGDAKYIITDYGTGW